MPKSYGLFRKFLISYLVILIIPSLAGYMSYRTSIAVTQSVSIENGVTQLQKSQAMLERRMAEVEGFTRQLALNQGLSVLMNETPVPGRSNVYGIRELVRDISAFSQTNDFLQNYYIYLKNYNVIVTPGTPYFRPEHYYQSASYSDLSIDQWKATILNKTHRSEIMPLHPFMYKGVQTSAISYLQSLPLDSFAESSPAVVVVVIDERTVASLLSGLTDRYGGWIHVSDAEGRPISAIGIGEQEFGRMSADARFDAAKTSQFYGDDLVISMTSRTTGWVYQAGIPKPVLMENANRIKYITWSVTGAALLIGLLAGLLLSYRNSAPINRLLGAVREQFGMEGAGMAGPGRNEYDFLQGNISAILTTNKRLESELNRQIPLVRDAFLKRLIAGEFQSPEELAAAASQAGVVLNEAGFAGILQINGYSGMDSVEVLNELNAARLLLKEALQDSGGPVHMTDMGADRVAAIFETGGAEAGRAAIEETLHRLAEFLFREYRITMTAAVGESFDTVMEVSRSYEQAGQALQYTSYAGKKDILWYSDTRIDSTTYYYPLDMELRLIGTIRAGELEEARRIVGTIMDENIKDRELSIEMRVQLIGELQGTLLKLLDQKAFLESDAFESVKKRVVDIQKAETPEAVHAEIDGIMETLCGVVVSRKSDMHIRLVDQIRAYIAEAYADPELTLYRVAEQVERPEKYISQLFKEVTGINLSDHLEKVRLDHAAALLESSAYTVDEIASRVGYNSSHSFRRAFKRVTGVSPSAYRQSAKG